jgi:hypothetical protein
MKPDDEDENKDKKKENNVVVKKENLPLNLPKPSNPSIVNYGADPDKKIEKREGDN